MKKDEDEGMSMLGVHLSHNIGEESYKYLGTLEADRRKMEDMKEKVRKEYWRKVRKVLEPRPNGSHRRLKDLIGLLMSYKTWIEIQEC